MTDAQLIDELYKRISERRIRLDLKRQGSGYAEVHIVTGKYGFDAMAYPKPIGHGD